MLRNVAAMMFGFLGAFASGCGDDGSSAEVPTLGDDIGFFGAMGFGEVEPADVYYGGVPTGHVFDIEWESWGEAKAIGHGTGYLDTGGGSANSKARPATVVAFRLGDCEGRSAYLDVRWFFEEDGDEIDLSGPAYYNICNGPDP